MNREIAAFARERIKAGLAQCNADQQRIFKLMYSPKDLDRAIHATVDAMPDDKLDWALSQVQATLEKNAATTANAAH